MTSLQALVTGMIAGALARAADEDGPGVAILIDVEIGIENGDYTNQVIVTGQESGERLVITVESEGADQK